jgi:MEDS: MEthanogen/methylotroph, DcmR Sensory domain
VTSEGPADHAVVFHSSDAELAGLAGDYLLRSLRSGSAVVIATPEHRRLFAAELAAGGVDVPAARAAGTYVELDAAETLARFLIDGWPDAAAFWQVISPVLAATPPGEVRAFGEMVALLWNDGRADAAIELEALWNELARHHELALLCAYEVASVRRPADADALVQVCGSHTRAVWPALS